MSPPLSLVPQERARLLRLATHASVSVAGVLIAAKLVAWLYTGSVTVLASLADSLMDALASLVNLFAVQYALRPADEDHRFGHGKAEALAGLGQATFIAGSALFLLFHAADRLIHPKPIQQTTLGVAVMVFAIVVTLTLLAIQHHVVRRTGSTAIRADALHYATDLATNLATIGAIALAAAGWSLADPLFAIAIALYILYSAWQILAEALALLMDQELPEDTREAIRVLALAPAEVAGVHGLKTRRSGPDWFVQLHLEMDGSLPLSQAHEVADQVEKAIARAYPQAEVIVHMDPVAEAEAG